jgi:Sap, sulfolipid-1-addressing protein
MAAVVEIFVLAFAAAVYPTLLAGVILILTRPRPRAQLGGFLAGGMAASLTAGFVILFALNGTGALGQSQHTVSPAVDLAVAAVSLAVAARLWRRPASVPRKAKPASDKPSWLDRSLGRGSLPLVLVAGVVLNLPGVWYLAALKNIGEGGYATVTDVVLVLAFNLIMFALVEVPLVWYFVSPAGAQAAVSGFNAWLHANSRRVGAVVAAAVGLYLLVKGVVQAV